MDEIAEKIKLLEENWNKVYKLSIANESQWQAQIKFSTPIQINEVVQTLINLLERVRSPKGFEPNFHLAKNLALSTLQQNITYLQNVAAGTWGHLPNFLNGLNQLLACFHNLIVFSDKKQMRTAIAELGDKLAQSLALVDTAQTEMKSKMELLNNSILIAEKVEVNGEKVEEVKTTSEEELTAIQKTIREDSKKVIDVVIQIKDSLSDIEELMKDMKGSKEAKKKLETETKEEKIKMDEVQSVISKSTKGFNDIVRDIKREKVIISEVEGSTPIIKRKDNSARSSKFEKAGD